MNPSSARFTVRHACWQKTARTIEGAATEAAARLEAGEIMATIYRCPFSDPAEFSHYHMTSHPKPASPARCAAALEVLGTEAYRKSPTYWAWYSEQRSNAEVRPSNAGWQGAAR
jgi:hypothetical protein